jgi:hypothetical protein
MAIREFIPSLMLGLLLIGGCSGGEEGGGNDEARPVPQSDVDTTGLVASPEAGAEDHSPPPPDAGCPTTHRNRLTVEPQTAEELAYLDDISACTDEAGSSTYVRNESDAVWTLATRIGGKSVEQLTHTPALESFRGVAQHTYQYPLLSPDSEVIVAASPTEVEWHLSPGLGAVWLFHDKAIDTVEDYGQGQLLEVLGGQSLRRKALITCANNVHQVSNEDLSGLTSQQPAAQLLAAIGIGTAGTECARAWQAADEDAVRRYRSVPTWEDDIARWADDPGFLRHADDQLTVWRRLGKAMMRIPRW